MKIVVGIDQCIPSKLAHLSIIELKLSEEREGVCDPERFELPLHGRLGKPRRQFFDSRFERFVAPDQYGAGAMP